ASVKWSVVSELARFSATLKIRSEIRNIPGRPAALGGMKKGDIIISIDGKTVSNIQDYMFRLQQVKPGQTISVEVLRNNQKVGLLIKL
ncbi:MAG TPA: PDZ domain-containing protein, partial [Bacteroidales bacterium]|nr:PDZ domain-containing protein [Bacteroidales bacterium]